VALTQLGHLYHDQGEYAAALKTHLESIRLKRETRDKTELVLSLVNLGALYFEHGNHEETMKLLEEAESLTKEVRAKLETVTCLNALGRLSIMLGVFGEIPTYLSNNPFARARQYARDGLKMAHYLGLKSHTLEALTTLALADIQEASISRIQADGSLGNSETTNKQLEQLYRSAYELLIRGESLLPHIHRKETQIHFLFTYTRYYLEKVQGSRLSEAETQHLITSAVNTSGRALTMTQELGLRRILPEALYLHFLALTLAGDKTRALNYLDQGRRLAEMMGLKPYLRVVSRSLTL
jgi:tetratricopeptide (TPR) repeat protein